jgi:hypothetical protein
MAFYLEIKPRELPVEEGVGGSGRDQPCQKNNELNHENLNKTCSIGLGSIWVVSAWKTTASIAEHSNS